MVLAAGNSVAGVAGAVGVAMDPTASDSCAAVSLAGPIRWDTETGLVRVCTAAGAVLAFLSVVSTTVSSLSCGPTELTP